ncbi:double-strand break repair protein MRE11 [Rhodotorula taiwanensis]|uniref:Double-strand break repair protein n=1 Tax=Rhodotorula taiwanensis TaxID=741276 RepID=A0A2S5BES7_9BASI|nr:double-strand break repair protein MRE11 [Rhodotorula taiwanensis]
MSSSPEPHEGGFAGPEPRLTQQVDRDSCIKILLATDNHIGYAEKDPIRGRDSINTFREILDLAVENDVDMLLLAGDLFHENRPSRTSLYQTISLMRERCLGDKPISLEIISDAGVGIARDASWPGINYEDENINVGLPVFSIHGNHDDPQGVGQEGALCALDVLSASGLINYFGRMELPGQSTNDEEALEDGLKVKPILLQKGDTKLALYGMGNIRDDRFVFELTNRRINLYRPAENPDDWFNIILVHQNRVPHGPNNSVPEQAFGEEAHLVVWGHEHDCISEAKPIPVAGRPYYISQPGSSIATSLSKGESIPKHVGLIQIQGKEFEFKPIRLRSVRPFIFEDLVLSTYHDKQTDDRKKLNSKVAVNKYLKAKVNELIDRANQEWDELHQDEEGQERLLPLIRLRVDYSGGPDGNGYFEVGNPQRFGQDFVDQVANPRDIVQFHRRSATRKAKVVMNEPDMKDLDAALKEAAETGDTSGLEKVTVTSLVHEYLEAQNLNVLSESLIQSAVDDFVGKGDKDAVGNWVKKLLKDTRNEILKKGYEPSKDGPEHDDLENEMRAAKDAAEAKYGRGARGKGKGKGRADEDEEDDDEGSGESDATPGPPRGRGASKGKSRARDSMDDDSDVSMASSAPTTKKKAPAKKAATTKSAAKGKGKAVDLFNESDSEEDSEASTSRGKKAPPKKAPAKKAAPASTARKPPARTAAKKATQSITIETDSSSEDSDPAPRKRKR